MRNCNRSLWTRPLAAWTLALLFAVSAPPGVMASPGDDAAREAIEKTDRVIAQTRKLLRELETDRGERAFDAAAYMQTDAREALDRGDFREARHLTLQARERVLRAIDEEPSRARGGERVEHELRTTDRYLHHAKNKLGPHRQGRPGDRRPGNRPNGPTRGRHRPWSVGGMEEHQAQAWEYYRQGELRSALRETLAVRERLETLRGFRDGAGPRSRGDRSGRLEMEIHRIGSFIARAEQMIADRHPDVDEHLRLANTAHGAALTALEDGNPKVAQGHVRESHELLQEVVAQVAKSLDEEEFKELQRDTRARWKAVADEPAQDDSLKTRRLLRRVDDSLEKSERSFYQGDTRAALLSLFRAMNTLDRANSTPRR